MSRVRLNELPEGSGNLTPDDIFVFMDNPSGGGVTKKISLSELMAFSGLTNTYDAAVSWSSNHTLVDGTRYLVNDLVYQNGRLYKANYENESEPVTNTTYWTDVGAGYRLNIDGRDIPNIPYPVLSVNGQTGSVTVDVPVTSVNGQIGDVIISTGETTTINTSLMQARLSLNTETISYTDILEATNLYYIPYDGNLITLYDATSGTWKYHNLSTITKNLNGINGDTNYDIFVYKNNNNLDLELVSWNNSAAGNSTRASALAMQDGVYVKNNEPQKRYIGSLRATTHNMCEDSFTKRFLWNYYNRINKSCGVDYVQSHTYGSQSIRAWNDNTTYGEGRSAFITGVSHALTIHYNAAISADTDGNHMLSGVGLNTTSDFACGCLTVANRNSSSIRVGSSSTISVPLGFNFLQSVEYAFIGTGTFNSSRITANIFC